MSCSARWTIVLVLALAPAHALAEPTTPDARQDPLAALRTLLDEEQYEQAERDSRQRLAGVERDHGADSARAAAVIDILVDALLYGGKAAEPETIELAERAAEIRERTAGAESADFAESLWRLGDVYLERGDAPAAVIPLERAVAIRETLADRPALLESLHPLAMAYVELDRYDDAERLYVLEATIIEQLHGARHVLMARNLYSRGRLRLKGGSTEDVLPLLTRSLEIARKALGERHAHVAVILNTLGIAHEGLGDFTEAHRSYEQALELAESELGEKSRFVADILNNLGLLEQLMGDYELAEHHLEKALSLSKELLGPRDTDTAVTMTVLGEVHGQQGHFARALELYEQALAIQEAVHGAQSSYLTPPLKRLGDLRVATGAFGRAIVAYERALAICESMLGRGQAFAASAKTGLARAVAESGELSRAEALLRDALQAQQTSLGPGHPKNAETLSVLSEVLFRSGQTGQAFDYALRTEAVSRGHLALTMTSLPERQALRYAARRPKGLDLAFSLVDGEKDGSRVSRAWDALTRSRASVLDEMASRRSWQDDGDVDNRRLAADLMRASRKLAHLFVVDPDPDQMTSYRDRVRAAEREREAAERALATRSARYRTMREAEQAGLDRVVQRLSPNTALLSYVRYRLHVPATEPGASESTPTARFAYLALLQLGKDGAPVAIPLGDAARVEDRVERWSREAARGALHRRGALQAYFDAGRRLREVIWDPVADRLREVDELYVVPDGPLAMVNLGTLPASDEQYLVEVSPLIHYLSAERDLVSDPAPAGEGMLLLGGADFDDASLFASPERIAPQTGPPLLRTEPVVRSSCGRFESMRFEALPASEAEVASIRTLWKRAVSSEDEPETPAAPREERVTALVGDEATEEAVKRLAPGNRILHLATHGFFLGGECSAAPLASRGIGGLTIKDDASSFPVENPLLLSGLVVAGANHRDRAGPEEEDGILTAAEIAALDLRGMQLAVLSACDTGAGSIEAGEGVLGLRRALRVAGAETVVMSLWAADDDAAREWMEAFYRSLFTEESSVAQATQDASRQVLRRRREENRSTHPFFWGGWIAAGGR